MSSGYVLHPEANTDLNLIWDFIAEDNLDAADRLVEQIHSSIQNLVQFPRQGHRRNDLHEQLRFHPIGNYLISYAPEEKPLLVIAILHGRRNPRTLAALLRGRE